MAIVHVTKSNFDEVVKNNPGKVLLDFWATWCGPCKMIAPILEEIAAEQPDLTIGKIDIDEEMDLAMQFQITSIPTLVLMENGQVADMAVGYRPKDSVVKFIAHN